MYRDIKALIDTGATITSISRAVATDLSLTPTGRVQTLGVHGPGWSNQYFVNLTFTGSDITLENRLVLDMEPHHEHFDMLIGRDILSAALFIYDGITGEFGLEIPSVSNPLSGKKWMQKQTVPAIRKTPDLKKKKKKRRAEKGARRKQRKKK